MSPIGSKVCFSIEEIDFGVLLPGKPAQRVIILYNLSKTNKLHYDFSASSIEMGLTCGDEFIIEPAHGMLDPT